MDHEIANGRVVLSFENKLREMEFFFNMIESVWKVTPIEFAERGKLRDTENLNRINHYFSSLSNSFQSIRAALHSITKGSTWNALSSIKYFSFLNSLETITHDGINALNNKTLRSSGLPKAELLSSAELYAKWNRT